MPRRWASFAGTARPEAALAAALSPVARPYPTNAPSSPSENVLWIAVIVGVVLGVVDGDALARSFAVRRLVPISLPDGIKNRRTSFSGTGVPYTMASVQTGGFVPPHADILVTGGSFGSKTGHLAMAFAPNVFPVLSTLTNRVVEQLFGRTERHLMNAQLVRLVGSPVLLLPITRNASSQVLGSFLVVFAFQKVSVAPIRRHYAQNGVLQVIQSLCCFL
jgi:hypothetical protein